jgi:hypothetical protein
MQPLSWTTLEFEEKDRHPDWIWYTGLIFAVAATLAFFYSNIFFGIFLVIAGASMIMFALRTPKQLILTIDEKVFTINDESIEYARIREFWIDETGKQDKLLLLVKGSFMPVLVFGIEGITAESIRTALGAKGCTEKFIKESLGVKIAERLGF